MISELDVYSLIFGSQLPKAKEFKYFVCAVIKSIRIHGCYPPPGRIPETRADKHSEELRIISALSDEEKKVEKEYTKIQHRATMKQEHIESRTRSAKTREDNRRNASVLLTRLLREKEEWEDLRGDYEEHLGILNQQLYDNSRAIIKLGTENRELERKNREKTIYILNFIRELQQLELENKK